METHTANLFVIIVTYKGQRWYERCFDSMLRSDMPIKVVVVDNASNDGTVEYIRTRYPEFHLIESKENLGFGRANNIGIRYALAQGCDYVFLLNQDAWVMPHTFSELIRIHQLYPEYGLLSPMHLTADESHIENGVLHYVDDHRITNSKLLEDLYFNRLSDVYATTYINAAAWLLPRKTIEKMGGFDPIYYHYGEDDDYLNRLRFHKIKIGICPKLQIVHDSVRPNYVCSQQQLIVRHHQELLVFSTDLNRHIRITHRVLFLYRKGICKAIRGDIRLARQLFADAQYLWRMRKRIKLSQDTNTKIQPSWL